MFSMGRGDVDLRDTDDGARNGSIRVVSMDGHKSVVTAAMLGRADACNAMVNPVGCAHCVDGNSSYR